MNITEDQLKAIEAALTFTGDPLEAHKACKAIRDNMAGEKLLKLARAEIKGLDDVDIDSDAGTSDYDEGRWVQAWVNVQKPTVECEACDGKGQLADAACLTCSGEGHIYTEFEDA